MHLLARCYVAIKQASEKLACQSYRLGGHQCKVTGFLNQGSLQRSWMLGCEHRVRQLKAGAAAEELQYSSSLELVCLQPSRINLQAPYFTPAPHQQLPTRWWSPGSSRTNVIITFKHKMGQLTILSQVLTVCQLLGRCQEQYSSSTLLLFGN